MKYIIISPYSKKLPTGKPCAKDYPFWEELVSLLKKNHDINILQIGISGETKIEGVDLFKINMPFDELKKEVTKCDFWISIDSFFQHFGTFHKKRGVTIFSKSNPDIFGHPENINVFKDKKYFRANQFEYWHNEPLDKESFVEPLKLYEIIKRNFID